MPLEDLEVSHVTSRQTCKTKSFNVFEGTWNTWIINYCNFFQIYSIHFCGQWHGREKENMVYAVYANDLTNYKPIQNYTKRPHQNKNSPRPNFFTSLTSPSAVRVDRVLGENIARCLQAPVASPCEASSSARAQTCHAK